MIESKNYTPFIIAILFIIAAVIIVFTIGDVDVYQREGALNQERKEELLAMKDKSFYRDRVLNYLGWTKEDVIFRHGEPDTVTAHYMGGEELFYSRSNIVFILAGEEGVVNNFYLLEGVEILGVRVGMTFTEIKEVLGEPVQQGFSEIDGEYMIIYYFGDRIYGGGELELWINANEELGPTNRFDVFWKRYWVD